MRKRVDIFNITAMMLLVCGLFLVHGISAKAAYVVGEKEEGYDTILCDDGWEYQIKADEAVVRGYRGSETVLTVPSAVKCIVNNQPEKTYPVGAIGEYAFSPQNKTVKRRTPITNVDGYSGICDEYAGMTKGAVVTSVTIPNTVDAIGVHAFHNNASITTVSIPQTVSIIGEYAFAECKALSSVNIPIAVTEISKWCFSGCESLTSAPLHNALKKIGDNAFSNCSSIVYVPLYEDLEEIGSSAFSGCKSIPEIRLPNSITKLGDGVFSSCENMISINIPTGITSIPSNFCQKCYSLRGISVPDNITNIGANAFAYCRDLCLPKYGGTVSLQENLISIGGGAFYDTPEMKSISVPYSVTSIGENAIGYYKSEAGTRLVPGFTIYGYFDTKAEEYAKSNGISFSGQVKKGAVVTSNNVEYTTTDKDEVELSSIKSTTISTFEVPKTITVKNKTYKVVGIGDKAFNDCKMLKKVTILANIKTIGESAFEGCVELTEVSIGKNVTSIGKKAFYKCSKLESITIKSKNIKTFGKNCFKGISKNAKIKVPAKKLSGYKKKIKKSGIAKKVSIVK